MKLKFLTIAVLYSILTAQTASSAALKCDRLFPLSPAEMLIKRIQALKIEVPDYVVRGFAHTKFSTQDLISMMAGNRQNELRSYVYQDFLLKELRDGVAMDIAIERADAETADDIIRRIKVLGLNQFHSRESMGSIIGTPLDQRTSSVLFATPPETAKVAMGYALGTAGSIMMDPNTNKKTLSSIRLFVVDVNTNSTATFAKSNDDFEYMIPSHIEGKAIRGAYVGFPQFGNPNSESQITAVAWVRIEPIKNAAGTLEKVQIFRATQNDSGLIASKNLILEVIPGKQINAQTLKKLINTSPDLALLFDDIGH